jgi:hypothetical protein
VAQKEASSSLSNTNNIHNTMRLRAIWCCLKFGLLPWWAYEKQRHYNCSYWQHLQINAGYAWRWLTFQEDEEDRAFERDTNA